MEKAHKDDDYEVFADTDKMWDRFWQSIDQSKELCLVTTYDMDHKLIAGVTLQKMINAWDRGVCCVLVIDDLNPYASSLGTEAFERAGGVVIRNNMFREGASHLMNGNWRKVFNRNHQKAMLVDEKVFIGSFNIADPYSGDNYGDHTFRDISVCVKMKHTRGIADFFIDILEENKHHL